MSPVTSPVAPPPLDLIARCFNLHRRPDRRFFIAQTLPSALQPHHAFFDAIDGKRLSAAKLERWRIEPSKYAINLSKRLAIREFLRSQADALLLLEDDVCFAPGFWESFQRFLAEIPDDWGLLFLGGLHIDEPTPLEGTSAVRCASVHGNHAWIIRRWCAPRVLQALGQKPFLDNYSDMIIASLNSEIPTYAPASWLAFQRLSESDNGFGLVNQSLWERPGVMQPWIHQDELAVMQSTVRPGMRVLEWGAGGSSLFLADCCGATGRFDSIEHDLAHAKAVQKQLHNAGLSPHATVHHVARGAGRARCETGLTQFRSYIDMAAKLSSPPFDACLVDGEERVACALSAAPTLRAGAKLFFHDFGSPQHPNFREWLPELLRYYSLLFEVTHTSSTMAVFERR